MANDRKELRDAARSLYEGSKMPIKQVAAEIGVSSRTVERWSSADGWARMSGSPHISQRARAVADRQRIALADLAEGASQEQKHQALAIATEEVAVDERAALLVRHRREWNVPRALLAEAIKSRDFEKAKLAKISAETTKITQDGERRAWGLDADTGTKVQVIIERD